MADQPGAMADQNWQCSENCPDNCQFLLPPSVLTALSLKTFKSQVLWTMQFVWCICMPKNDTFSALHEPSVGLYNTSPPTLSKHPLSNNTPTLWTKNMHIPGGGSNLGFFTVPPVIGGASEWEREIKSIVRIHTSITPAWMQHYRLEGVDYSHAIN